MFVVEKHKTFSQQTLSITIYTLDKENLPMEIKTVADNPKKFTIVLKKFLYTYSFYTFDEYYSESWIKYCVAKTAYYIGIRCEVFPLRYTA